MFINFLKIKRNISEINQILNYNDRENLRNIEVIYSDSHKLIAYSLSVCVCVCMFANNSWQTLSLKIAD